MAEMTERYPNSNFLEPRTEILFLDPCIVFILNMSRNAVIYVHFPFFGGIIICTLHWGDANNLILSSVTQNESLLGIHKMFYYRQDNTSKLFRTELGWCFQNFTHAT